MHIHILILATEPLRSIPACGPRVQFLNTEEENGSIPRDRYCYTASAQGQSTRLVPCVPGTWIQFRSKLSQDTTPLAVCVTQPAQRFELRFLVSRHLNQSQRTLDGNFQCNQFTKNTDPDDVSLCAGKGYFPLDSEYKEYLARVPVSTEVRQFPESSQHNFILFDW